MFSCRALPTALQGPATAGSVNCGSGVCDSGGGSGWHLAGEYSYDALFQGTKVLDSTGAPVDNAAVTVTAVPIDTSSWPSGEPYPQVGSGSTDSDGYAEASLGTGLASVQGSPAFETEDGQMTLAVNYTDDSGKSAQAFTVGEDLTSYNDPVLQQQTLKTPGGTVLANTSLVVKAEPQYSDASADELAYKQVASCATDSSGHPNCSLDLSTVQGNSDYETHGVLTYDIWYTDGSGQPQLALRAQEFRQWRLGSDTADCDGN